MTVCHAARGRAEREPGGCQNRHRDVTLHRAAWPHAAQCVSRRRSARYHQFATAGRPTSAPSSRRRTRRRVGRTPAQRGRLTARHARWARAEGEPRGRQHRDRDIALHRATSPCAIERITRRGCVRRNRLTAASRPTPAPSPRRRAGLRSRRGPGKRHRGSRSNGRLACSERQCRRDAAARRRRSASASISAATTTTGRNGKEGPRHEGRTKECGSVAHEPLLHRAPDFVSWPGPPFQRKIVCPPTQAVKSG